MKIDVSQVGVNMVVDVVLPSFAAVANAVVLWGLHRWGEEWLLLPIASAEEEVEPLKLTDDDMELIEAAVGSSSSDAHRS